MYSAGIIEQRVNEVTHMYTSGAGKDADPLVNKILNTMPAAAPLVVASRKVHVQAAVESMLCFGSHTQWCSG